MAKGLSREFFEKIAGDGVVKEWDESHGVEPPRRALKSTQAMRDRIRELMTNPQDDYDRAVECVLDDLEGLLGAVGGVK